MLTTVVVSLVAVVFAYVAWRAWHKHQPAIPPWGMSEFHRRNKGSDETPPPVRRGAG